MKKSINRLLIISFIIASSGSPVIAGRGGGSSSGGGEGKGEGMSSPVQNRTQSEFEQRQMNQYKAQDRSGQDTVNPGVSQGDRDRVRDMDQDPLKQLDQDITREQLREQDRDRINLK